MENIWAFLLQTLTVSMVAALILFLKWLFQDKLSPRWQYGVWIILLLRIILPKQMDRALFFNLPVWVETIKAMVEQNLQSAYTDAFIPLSMYHFVPFIQTAPVSITDWLFVLYVAGIIGMLLWYVLSYVRLRLLLRKGSDISVEQRQTIAHVCSKYDLTACKTVAVPGLPSAFVCGIIHPVLALPANTSVDEKIILHELLHLQHRDALRNVGWSILRAFHWCNPFMQMVFRRIGNDIESLCDQRVLERLEGEERREYGNILLNMANRQYARAPGTTSISNGGKNISRRIAAIVRFKKYPQGMALVSVCIVLVLAVPAMAGTEITYSQNDYEPKQLHELDKAMALARINHCTTVAGALDTYAKGLLSENGVYIATVTPAYYHEALYEQMKKANIEDGWAAYHLDSGDELKYVTYDDDHGYSIYSLEQTDNSVYEAILAFRTRGFPDGNGYKLRDENGTIIENGVVFVPVEVKSYTGLKCLVRETGERVIVPNACDKYGNMDSEHEPVVAEIVTNGEYGTIRIQWTKRSVVENSWNRGGQSYRGGDFFKEFRADSEFFNTNIMRYIEYDITTKQTEEKPTSSVGYQVRFKREGEEPPVLDAYMGGNQGYYSDKVIKDSCYIHNYVTGVDWDGTIRSGSTDNYKNRIPQAYLVGIYWDGHLVEEFRIEEGGVRGDISREIE